MTRDEWRITWVKTLLDAGIEHQIAEDAFEVFYADQEIDLTADPALAASILVPVALGKRL